MVLTLLACAALGWVQLAPQTQTSLPIAVNETTKSDQTELSLAAIGDSVFAVWSSRKQNNGTDGVYGRVLGTDLTPRSDEFPLFQSGDGPQSNPSVVSVGDRFVAVWERAHEDGVEICARAFGADGIALTDEQVVGTGSVRQAMTRVTVDGETVVIVWRDHGGLMSASLNAGLSFESPVARLLPMPRPPHSLAVASGDGALTVAMGVAAEESVTTELVFAQVAGGRTTPILSLPNPQSVDPSLISTTSASGGEVVWAAWTDLSDPYSPRTVAGQIDFEDQSIELITATNPGESGESAVRAVAPSWVESRGNVRLVDQVVDVAGAAFIRVREQGGAQQLQPVAESWTLDVQARAGRAVGVGDSDILVGGVGEVIWPGWEKSDRRGVGVTRVTEAKMVAPPDLVRSGTPADGRIALLNLGETQWAAPVDWPEETGVQPAEESGLSANGEVGYMPFENPLGSLPADPDVAVGPTQICVVVNRQLKVLSKADPSFTECTLNLDLAGPPTAGDYFDPVILYHTVAQRFILVTTYYRSALTRVAVSKSSTLSCQSASDWTTSWDIYDWVDPASEPTSYQDFPTLGYFGNKILISYIGTLPRDSLPETPDEYFSHVAVFDLASRTFELGAAFDMGANSRVRVVSPARQNGLDSIGYILSDFTNGRTIALKAVSPGSGVTPSTVTDNWFPLAVDHFIQPISIPQGNSSFRMTLLDSRTKHAVYRDGFIWFATNAGVLGDGAPKIHWYKVAPNGWPLSGQDPVLVQQGVLDFGNDVATAFPGIAVTADVNGSHRLVIVHSRSSPAEPLAVWRTIIDETGEIVNTEMWKSSEGPNVSYRWGDYFGVAEDPSTPGVFWGHGMYQGQTAWRTWLGRVDAWNP